MMESYVHKGVRYWREVPEAAAPPKQPNVREAMGQVLREKRVEKGLNLRDMRGVSLGFVSEVERGKKEPSSEILQALCTTLEISVADILRCTADRLERELASA